MPAVSTATTTWPGPAMGSGTSSSVNRVPPCQVATFMAATCRRGGRRCSGAGGRRAPSTDGPSRWCGDGILPEAFQAAAVDVQRDAGDEAGALGAQKGDGVRQLLRPSPAAERVLTRGQPPRLVLGAGAELGDEAGSVAFPHA